MPGTGGGAGNRAGSGRALPDDLGRAAASARWTQEAAGPDRTGRQAQVTVHPNEIGHAPEMAAACARHSNWGASDACSLSVQSMLPLQLSTY
jgi:hypothetical protein